MLSPFYADSGMPCVLDSTPSMGTINRFFQAVVVKNYMTWEQLAKVNLQLVAMVPRGHEYFEFFFVGNLGLTMCLD